VPLCDFCQQAIKLERVYTENSDSRALVVQSAKDWMRYDTSRAMNWALDRRTQASMITASTVSGVDLSGQECSK